MLQWIIASMFKHIEAVEDIDKGRKMMFLWANFLYDFYELMNAVAGIDKESYVEHIMNEYNNTHPQEINWEDDILV